MDKKPVWSENYRFGIPEIDRQHEDLFIIFWELLKSIEEEPDQEQVSACFEKLYRHVSYHFDYEEQIMTSTHYHELPVHRKIHTEIKQDLQALFSIYMETDEPEVKLEIPRKVAEFLEEWLEDHINHTDRQYATHILAQTTIG